MMENTYKKGDLIDVIAFGKPSKDKIIEYDDNIKMFKCQFDYGNASGSCWRSIENIIEMKNRVNEYKELESTKIYWKNGGHNGPTGHGPNICYSDADNGL